MNILGLDIGGANVKAVSTTPSANGRGVNLTGVVRRYHPLWLRGVESLKLLLEEIKQEFSLRPEEYYVGVTMTAELSDIFKTKHEGVKTIIEVVDDVYSDAKGVYYVSADMKLVGPPEALRNYLKIAAANWAASAWLLERKCLDWGVRDAVFIDIGSTTTTIIPMVDCSIRVRGYTDPEKLVYGELVYTGVLRGNVAALVDRVPYKGFYARVSSERFSLMGDVHLLLGHISSEDYTTETADGRGTTLEEAMQRIARVPCADSDTISLEEAVEIARYIYEKQVFAVFEALMQVRSWLASQGVKLDKLTAITAGLGEFLAAEASRRAGFKRVVSINELVGEKVASVLPSYASALMVLDKVAGRE
uniref:H4MPT-linked C1 transfer pathway protein n=1 Tax=Thermofilum pendens TaxID=2269 RepID=A0A7C1TB33_THEPE